MNLKIYLYALLILGVWGCKTRQPIIVYESEHLKIEKLAPNTYRHISYLFTEEYGKVGCNGMIVTHDGEALVFDTPTNDKDSKELIDWIKTTLKRKVVGVVATHFHSDCLGGLDEFHARKIPSYASNRTIGSAQFNKLPVPQTGFENYLEIKVGKTKVVNEFFGEGHTMDNIVSYFPKDRVLFGGCLIKSVGAGKGFTGDANLNEWSPTVQAVKSKYKKAEIVIPGHGSPGTIELLDYTIQLFKTE